MRSWLSTASRQTWTLIANGAGNRLRILVATTHLPDWFVGYVTVPYAATLMPLPAGANNHIRWLCVSRPQPSAPLRVDHAGFTPLCTLVYRREV